MSFRGWTAVDCVVTWNSLDAIRAAVTSSLSPHAARFCRLGARLAAAGGGGGNADER